MATGESADAFARAREPRGWAGRIVLLLTGALVSGLMVGVFVGSATTRAADEDGVRIRAELDEAHKRIHELEAVLRPGS